MAGTSYDRAEGPEFQPARRVLGRGGGGAFGRQSYVNLAVEAVLNGDLDLPVYVGEGVALRAEVVVRQVLPQLIENLAARERFVALVAEYTGSAA